MRDDDIVFQKKIRGFVGVLTPTVGMQGLMEKYGDFVEVEEGGDWEQASAAGSESVVSTERCTRV